MFYNQSLYQFQVQLTAVYSCWKAIISNLLLAYFSPLILLNLLKVGQLVVCLSIVMASQNVRQDFSTRKITSASQINQMLLP